MIAQVNHSQIATVLTNYNPPNEIIFAEDHQIDGIHNITHKIDIVDQTVEFINIETVTLVLTTPIIHPILIFTIIDPVIITKTMSIELVC